MVGIQLIKLPYSPQYGPYPVALRSGHLPQHSVRPLIHLDYRACKFPSLTTGLSGIQTLPQIAPKNGKLAPYPLYQSTTAFDVPYKTSCVCNMAECVLCVLGRGGVPGRPGQLLPVDGEDVVVAGREVLLLHEPRPQRRRFVRETVEQDLDGPVPAT